MSRRFPAPLGSKVLMRQTWSHVSFVHWRVQPSEVAHFMPEGCTPDIIDGSAWVGIVAFEAARTALFSLPPIPWVGDFPEINVRTYSVDSLGRRGVFFLSLDAARLVPVIAARVALGLPYRWSAAQVQVRPTTLIYQGRRIARPSVGIQLEVVPHVNDEESLALQSDPIAIALTARWALHQQHIGRSFLVRNMHEPWQLFPARLEYLEDDLVQAAGCGHLTEHQPDSVLYSPGVDAVFGFPRVTLRDPTIR